MTNDREASGTAPRGRRGSGGGRAGGEWSGGRYNDEQSGNDRTRGEHPGRDRRDDSRRDSKGRERSAARARGESARSQQAPSERRRATDPSRLLAYDVLRDVADSDSYANLVLPPRLRQQGLTGRDAAFATELTYGTLRLRARYDAVLAYCVDRPLTQVDDALLDALRLGAHQILGMRVPTHAAVSETVGLVRTRMGTGASQLTNAVLRKVAAHDWPQWAEKIAADKPDRLTALAALQSHPQWIVRAFREALASDGRDVAEIEALLAADNTAPKVTLAARPGLISVAALRDEAGGVVGQLSPYAVIMPAHDPGAVSAVRSGFAGVQDEGSQLVTSIFAAVPVDGDDERWLDMCAGPGGKSTLLAAIAAQRGARIVANEVAEHRTALVRENLRAVPASAVEAVRTGDGREIGEAEPAGYDRVLVDAPCTGLGALRRRPEARWRRKPSDLPDLTALQRDLLVSALDATRSGGIVGYVTCSPHVAETRLVVEDVLRHRADAKLLDVKPYATSVSGDAIELSDHPGLQLWPHVHGTDAMHLSVIRKM